MGERVKNIITLVIVFVVCIGIIRMYDYVTKDPVPIDRTENPEITKLNKRIDAVMDSFTYYKKESGVLYKSALMSLDSIKIYHKKSKNEHRKLKNTPDASLIHYRDSVRIANGL